MEDLPYRAEYAKSNRASCRGCKSQIAKDTLRLAVMVQSAMYDGKTPQWYHHMCFFGKQRPRTVDDIAHYESLRWEDQQTIKLKLESVSSVVLPTKKGKKRDASAAISNMAALKDFRIEYSKSSRAVCRGCEQKIMKDEVRIAKKDFETEVGRKYGGQDLWHHLSCFAKLRSELGYFESGEVLPGFKALGKDDQRKTKDELRAIKQEEVPSKKVKAEDSTDGKQGDANEKLIKEQNKKMFKYRDQLKDKLNKKELQMLLEANDQEVPVGIEIMLDRICDIMTFGALLPCKECKTGQLAFNKIGYVCQGDLTEWTKCQTVTDDPQRIKFKVPTELAQEYSFLGSYKSKPCKRIIKAARPSSTIVKKEEAESNGPKVKREKPALYGMEFIIIGKLSKDKDAVKKEITSLGGKVVTKIQSSVMAVISNKGEVERMGSRMEDVKTEDVHVVSADFVTESKEYVGKIPELVVKKSICSWGSDPNTRLPKEEDEATKSKLKSKSGSMYTKSMPSTMKLQLKGGTAVDPESGLADVAHVYKSKNDKYTVVLGKTDIQSNKNSYYKIQILESDKNQKYWVFRSWGRIGTTIGSSKLESMTSLHEAKTQFKLLYEEKSGNMWEYRHEFTKIPGRMWPIDVDYSEDESKLKIADDTPCKLPKPVEELIRMIFNVDTMKKMMLEFELDMEKMPLGKLSKSQIQSAYSVLTELQKLMESNGSRSHFIDASNRFYTFIPHSFGIDEPPIINTTELIKQKIDMLDNLMELEIAYSLMKSGSAQDGNQVENHYNQLKTEISVLEKTSEEFSIIQEYVKNTHAATHTTYQLEIDEVFVVKRRGEEKRYKPFKKLPNRRLLWHGSRTTNYAGILSQGLRIAPPEAPVTGYMFGKGIYFADMVSKSANYCCTTSSNSTGLMLLCEVALGEIFERDAADYIEKLPKGKHSVQGVGMTAPDPGMVKEIHDGVQVPLGQGKSIEKNTTLLYNEFIVYDVAQVKCKYLLKMKFKYNY